VPSSSAAAALAGGAAGAAAPAPRRRRRRRRRGGADSEPRDQTQSWILRKSELCLVACLWHDDFSVLIFFTRERFEPLERFARLVSSAASSPLPDGAVVHAVLLN
jgi:hypothetical protein